MTYFDDHGAQKLNIHFFTSKTLAACAARYPNAYIVRCSIRKVVLSIKQNIMRFSIFRQESFKTHDDENW